MASMVEMMFHPSHRAPDLEIAAAFFAKVFGRPSRMLDEVLSAHESTSAEKTAVDYPRDYCMFTPIRDVFFDTIDPRRYVIKGEQRYPTVTEPHLKSFGWYVSDPQDVYTRLGEAGIRCRDQLNRIADGPTPPLGQSRKMYLFWSLEDDTGLAYEFYPGDRRGLGDERRSAGWKLPPVAADDPLGISRCSHHTVLTDMPDRALRLVVDVLGGKVVEVTENEVLGTRSTFVHLAGSTIEYAQPIKDGTPAIHDLDDHLPHDAYHSITWQVSDLARAAAHLESVGVGFRLRTDALVLTDPATSLGIPWGFTEELVPNDPR